MPLSRDSRLWMFVAYLTRDQRLLFVGVFKYELKVAIGIGAISHISRLNVLFILYRALLVISSGVKERTLLITS